MHIEIGSVIYAAAKPMFKIYLILGTGFLLAKLNILTVDVTRNVSDMVVTVVLPCLAFNKIVENISISDLKSIGVICLSAAILYSFGAFCSLLVILGTPLPKKWRGGCMAGGIFPNISDLPIAYIQTLDTGAVFTEVEGNKGIAYVCIFLMTFLFCQFNMGGFKLVEYDFRNPSDLESNMLQNNKLHKSSSNKNSDTTLDSSTNYDDDMKDKEKVQLPSSPIPSAKVVDAEKSEDLKTQMNNLDDDLDNLPDDDSLSGSSDMVSSLSSSAASHIGTENQQDLPQEMLTGQEQQQVKNQRTSLRRRRGSGGNSFETQSVLTRLSSGGSSLNTNNTLSQTMSRNLQLRVMPSQTMRNVVEEYSHANNREALHKINTLTKIITTDIGAANSEAIQEAGASIGFIQKYHLNFLVFCLQSLMRPVSVALLLSILIALVPWLKALFVRTPRVPDMPNAPDGLPPLSFILDYTSYIGQASVPLGLLLLGTTIARLSIGDLDKKFFISSATLVVLKLCICPIVGVAWASKLRSLGWLNDSMIFFVICITFSLPSATTQFYITATNISPDSEDHTQMECLSIYLLMQYLSLSVTLPFLVTYVVMKQL